MAASRQGAGGLYLYCTEQGLIKWYDGQKGKGDGGGGGGRRERTAGIR